MSSIRINGLGAAIVCLMLLTLSGCARESARDQMSWARAALERNSDIEIVATDPQTHTFTVRDKASGALRMVRADELVGGAAGSASAPAAAQVTTQAEATAPAAAAATAAPAASSAWRSDQAGSAAASSDAEGSSQSGATPAAPARASGEGVSDGGQVLKSGPGYTIKTAAPVAGAGARGGSSGITTAAVEHRHEPIVCQGARLVQIDNRNLVFDGDAVSAEDGCEIHITNSRISATGVGVSARAAKVFLDNSQIEGDTASIDASQGAQIYAGQSRFRGLARRLDTAAFHDLGGNVWN